MTEPTIVQMILPMHNPFEVLSTRNVWFVEQDSNECCVLGTAVYHFHHVRPHLITRSASQTPEKRNVKKPGKPAGSTCRAYVRVTIKEIPVLSRSIY